MLFHLLSGRWHRVKALVFHIERHIPLDLDHKNSRHVAKVVGPWNFMKFIFNPLVLMCLTKTTKVLDTLIFRNSNDQGDVLWIDKMINIFRLDYSKEKESWHSLRKTMKVYCGPCQVKENCFL